jgi:hypothetical protein
VLNAAVARYDFAAGFGSDVTSAHFAPDVWKMRNVPGLSPSPIPTYLLKKTAKQ